MSTKYVQYLLKTLSVTASTQVSAVTPTIPCHAEQFQTRVALLSQLLRTKVSSVSSDFVGDTRRTRGPQKKWSLCPNPSVSLVRVRIRFLSRVKSTGSSTYVGICGLNFRRAFTIILTLQLQMFLLAIRYVSHAIHVF